MSRNYAKESLCEKEKYRRLVAKIHKGLAEEYLKMVFFTR